MIRRKSSIFILLIIIGIILCIFSERGYSIVKDERIAKELRVACKRLNLNMNHQDVVAVMGNPSRIIERTSENGEKQEVWFFKSPWGVSTETSVIIDKESAKVERIICDEDFDIHK